MGRPWREVKRWVSFRLGKGRLRREKPLPKCHPLRGRRCKISLDAGKPFSNCPSCLERSLVMGARLVQWMETFTISLITEE